MYPIQSVRLARPISHLAVLGSRGGGGERDRLVTCFSRPIIDEWAGDRLPCGAAGGAGDRSIPFHWTRRPERRGDHIPQRYAPRSPYFSDAMQSLFSFPGQVFEILNLICVLPCSCSSRRRKGAGREREGRYVRVRLWGSGTAERHWALPKHKHNEVHRKVEPGAYRPAKSIHVRDMRASSTVRSLIPFLCDG